MTTKISEKKRAAIRLLREHDKLRARLRILEREAVRACSAYGVETGRWGLRLDHLRIELQMEEEHKQKEQADAQNA